MQAIKFLCHDPVSKGKKNQFHPPTIIKSDFQSSKLDNRDHPTIKTDKFGTLGGFKGGFSFYEKLKYSSLN
jgi:hypothetical protein